MEKDLRLMVLSIAVSRLIRHSGLTNADMQQALLEYLRSHPPEDGPLSAAAVEFCADTMRGLASGPNDTTSH